mgnify:CR=1 FL=1
MWTYRFEKSNWASRAPVKIFNDKKKLDLYRIKCRRGYMLNQNKNKGAHFQPSDASNFKINVNVWGARSAFEYVIFTPNRITNCATNRVIY